MSSRSSSTQHLKQHEHQQQQQQQQQHEEAMPDQSTIPESFSTRSTYTSFDAYVTPPLLHQLSDPLPDSPLPSPCPLPVPKPQPIHNNSSSKVQQQQQQQGAAARRSSNSKTIRETTRRGRGKKYMHACMHDMSSRSSS
ncbi:hypothetical protein Emag_006683 [Eimeria magna]